ncbi:MAG: 4Fe-4S binding protein, partial [Gemmatimonadetes bacterium]|nr:4Fe-4S binding protein [Gemmatimonadota bacterium]
GDAIYQDSQLRPVVTDACVGCGICERVCPAESAAIHIRPHL